MKQILTQEMTMKMGDLPDFKDWTHVTFKRDGTSTQLVWNEAVSQ